MGSTALAVANFEPQRGNSTPGVPTPDKCSGGGGEFDRVYGSALKSSRSSPLEANRSEEGGGDERPSSSVSVASKVQFVESAAVSPPAGRQKTEGGRKSEPLKGVEEIMISDVSAVDKARAILQLLNRLISARDFQGAYALINRPDVGLLLRHIGGDNRLILQLKRAIELAKMDERVAGTLKKVLDSLSPKHEANLSNLASEIERVLRRFSQECESSKVQGDGGRKGIVEHGAKAEGAAEPKAANNLPLFSSEVGKSQSPPGEPSQAPMKLKGQPVKVLPLKEPVSPQKGRLEALLVENGKGKVFNIKDLYAKRGGGEKNSPSSGGKEAKAPAQNQTSDPIGAKAASKLVEKTPSIWEKGLNSSPVKGDAQAIPVVQESLPAEVRSVSLPQAPATYRSVEAQIVQQIVQRVQVLSGDGKTTMHIALKPEFLGRVTLHLESQDGVMTAKFFTENFRVKELIESNLAQLRQSLSEHNLEFAKIEVMVGSGREMFADDRRNGGGEIDRGARRRQHLGFDEEQWEEDLAIVAAWMGLDSTVNLIA
ncbi:MAG: flagellar hook-length control protein FliK [bacterium]